MNTRTLTMSTIGFGLGLLLTGGCTSPEKLVAAPAKAAPAVLMNGWVPNEEVRAKVRDLSASKVERIILHGPGFETRSKTQASDSDAMPVPRLILEPENIDQLLTAMQSSITRPGRPIPSPNGAGGRVEIELRAGGGPSIQFAWASVRYELGIRTYRVLQKFLVEEPGHGGGYFTPPESTTNHYRDKQLQGKLDAIDEIGIDQIELEGPAFGLKQGERAIVSKLLSNRAYLAYHLYPFVNASSSAPQRKVRPEACDSLATFVAQNGKDKVEVPMHSKTLLDDWGIQMDIFLKMVRESDFGRTRGVPTSWEIWKNGKLVRPAGEDQKND